MFLLDHLIRKFFKMMNQILNLIMVSKTRLRGDLKKYCRSLAQKGVLIENISRKYSNAKNLKKGLFNQRKLKNLKDFPK